MPPASADSVPRLLAMARPSPQGEQLRPLRATGCYASLLERLPVAVAIMAVERVRAETPKMP